MISNRKCFLIKTRIFVTATSEKRRTGIYYTELKLAQKEAAVDIKIMK